MVRVITSKVFGCAKLSTMDGLVSYCHNRLIKTKWGEGNGKEWGKGNKSSKWTRHPPMDVP